jgi:hypothetical protein
MILRGKREQPEEDLMSFGYVRSDPDQLVQMDVLAYLVRVGPGRTAAELAQAVHGDAAYQQQVNQDLVSLVSNGSIERRGNGAPGDSFRYYPAEK